jgi:hypothetical protein
MDTTGERKVRFGPIQERIIQEEPTKRTESTPRFISINMDQPAAGSVTQCFASQFTTHENETLLFNMCRTTVGEQSGVQTTLTHDILDSLQHVTGSAKYTLLCMSKSSTSTSATHGIDMVFALVGDLHKATPTKPVRAILYVKGIANGTRFIHVLKLPSASCTATHYTGDQSRTWEPHATWLLVLKELKISPTDVSKASHMNEEAWGRYCTKHSRKGVSHIITRNTGSNTVKKGVVAVSLGPGGMVNELGVVFTQHGVNRTIDVDAGMADLLFVHIKEVHGGIVKDTRWQAALVYNLPIGHTGFTLTFTLVHATRVQCCIRDTSPAKTLLSSSTVNFCNSIVHVNTDADGVENTRGVQRLAVRLAKKLKDNLTPSMIAARLVSNEVSTCAKHLASAAPHAKLASGRQEELTKLMATTDLLHDLEYVTSMARASRGMDINQTVKATHKRLISHLGEVYTTTCTTHKKIQDDILAGCVAFKNKKTKASILAAQPWWQDCPPNSTNADGLLNQRMTSARGVAVLSLLPGHELAGGRHVEFSAMCVPRLVQKPCETHKIHTPLFHNCNSTTGPVWEAPRSLLWTPADTTDRFTYKYDKFSHAVEVLHVNTPIALFPKPRSTAPISTQGVPVAVSNESPQGSLMCALVDLAIDSRHVYVRALAHLVLVSATNSYLSIHGPEVRGGSPFMKPNTEFTEFNDTTRWLNYYRTMFLRERIVHGIPTGEAMEQLYEDYCIFGQCLVSHVSGSTIPHDMFALLVQQGLPFPET